MDLSGVVEPNPAIHNHLCHHWLATDVELTGEMDLDEGEDIELVFMREEEIVEAVRRGEIRHALALSVLSRVFDLWPRPLLAGRLTLTSLSLLILTCQRSEQELRAWPGIHSGHQKAPAVRDWTSAPRLESHLALRRVAL